MFHVWTNLHSEFSSLFELKINGSKMKKIDLNSIENKYLFDPYIS